MRPEINVLPAAPESYGREFPEYPAVIQQLLFNRQLDSSLKIHEYLKPDYIEHGHDPMLFRDMKKACERLYRAIDDHEIIAIHGDYDADGVTASVILSNVLNKLGARTIVYLPHRELDGYGLNLKTVDYLHEQGARVIITADCGISNGPEIDAANGFGIDTIVTDHHQIPDKIPAAFAIIHPKLPEEKYPFKFLSGGGVAFKLIQGLLADQRCQLDSMQKESTEKWLLDLVAVSSIADMVELIGENRTLTVYGLMVLRRNQRLGLQKLMSRARIEPNSLSSQTVAFQIVPRINAAGRMDHANSAYLLLSATDDGEAERLAEILEGQNRSRQLKTDRMYQQALEMVADSESSAMIFYRPDWPIGLAGLVAGKLSKNFARPVFVLMSDGSKIVGSGRSPEGVNIIEAVTSIKTHLLSFGGHPQACGLRYDFALHEAVCGGLKNYFEQPAHKPTGDRRLTVECELRFSDINWDLVDLLERCEPFGVGNAQPLFYSSAVSLETIRAVGQKMNHAKLALRRDDRTFSAIAFGQAGQLLEGHKIVDIVYSIEANHWNGSKEIQLSIKKAFV